ncbi:PASTA domain-containing protein [Nocardia sp. NPDC058658]|uniref:PASTA domain-containing protein n=1 Tax=Nocardia sp. NPDC058658 TaxID=3346580 RepID=UPI00364D3F4D
MGVLSGCSTAENAAPPRQATAPTSTQQARATGDLNLTEYERYRQSANNYGKSGLFFQSPSGMFHCAIFDQPMTNYEMPIQAACTGREAATPQGEDACAKREVGNSPIPAAGVGASGSLFLCVTEPVFYGKQDALVLPYGSTVIGNGISCTSSETDISCSDNFSGEYFSISRESTELSSTRATTAVPSVLGERPGTARNTLTAAGFQVKIVGGENRGKNGGQCMVATQQPAAGTNAPANSVVTLETEEIGAAAPC